MWKKQQNPRDGEQGFLQGKGTQASHETRLLRDYSLSKLIVIDGIKLYGCNIVRGLRLGSEA